MQRYPGDGAGRDLLRYTAGGVRRHHGGVGGGEEHAADDPRGVPGPHGRGGSDRRRRSLRAPGGRPGRLPAGDDRFRLPGVPPPPVPDGAGERDGAHVAGAGLAPGEGFELADALLASVGLAGKEDRLPSQLSGGESQRVAIARALVHDPPVLLADEPTGNLDSATGEQILDLFSSLHARGKTVLMVTHNPANLARATRSLRLRDGRVEEDRLLRSSSRGAGGGLNPGLQRKKGRAMEEETGMQESSGMRESTETAATGDSHTAEGRRGPGWKGWVLSILVAIILSVTATLLLGGSGSFRPDRAAVAAGAAGGGSGAGSSCCPPADCGKVKRRKCG